MPYDQLEPALQSIERDIDGVMKSVLAALKEVKRAKSAAELGQLRDLRHALDEAARLAEVAAQTAATAREGWDFDDQQHFATGAYAQEVLARAKADGVNVYYSDDRILSYPAIVAISPSDLCVLVDKKRDRRVRPSIFVRTLKALQTRPPRFKAEAFLEALALAYDLVVAKSAARAGAVVKLVDVYAVLTVMPGAAREYSKQEFARDLYLLDMSGVTATRSGRAMSFAASALTRGAGVLNTVTKTGQEKVYAGVQFAVAE